MASYIDYRKLEPLSEEYYQLVQNCITVDSCEFSNRTEYVCNMIDYLNSEKGVIAIALSATSVSKNVLYMSYLPDPVRTMIYNLGLFHTYQKYVKVYEEALNILYVDNKYCPVIEYMTLSVRSLQIQVIKKLKSVLNCVIILDRSAFSSYLYSKTLTKDENLSDFTYITKMRPLKAFFITSCRALEIKKGITSLKTYDRVKNINEQLYQKIYALECTIPDFKTVFPLVIVQQPYQQAADTNMSKNLTLIKAHLNQIF